MPIRRRQVGEGFEAYELEAPRPWRADPQRRDVDLLQGGGQRRVLVERLPSRSMGPEVHGRPLQRANILDQPGGNIGRSETYVLAAANKTTASNILNVVGDDAKTRAMTVTLGVELFNPAAADRIDDAFANLYWGAGGVQYAAVVDILSGTVVQVSASSIRVDVRASGAGTLKVSAFVGYETTGDRKARRTVSGGGLAVGAVSAAIPIPAFAESFQVQRVPATANLTVSVQNRAGTALAEWIVGNGPADGTEVCWLPVGASQLVLTNGLGAVLTSSRIVFGLCL